MKKLTTFSGLHCRVTLAVMLISAGVGQGAETSGRIGTQAVPITLPANPYKDRRPTAKYRLDTARQSRNQKEGNAMAELLSWCCENSNHNQPLRFQPFCTKIQFLCHRSSFRI